MKFVQLKVLFRLQFINKVQNNDIAQLQGILWFIILDNNITYFIIRFG